VAAVNLLVTDGAIAKARRSQVMEGGRHNSRHDSAGIRDRQVGMAFETDEAHFLPDQHLRVRGTVRQVATLAAFFPDRSVLEGEGSAFVAMTLEAARLIGARHPHEAGFEAAVRIVAIDAGHRIFRHPMFERLGKRRFHINVAALAEGVDFRGFAHDESFGTVRVNRMARRAGDGVACVAGFEPAGSGGLISMTGETRLVGLGR